MILRAFLHEENLYGKNAGFYVDVGAHHPFRFSNTAFFYKNGWSGINIEPTPDMFGEFVKLRLRDINLNFAIGTSARPLTFHVFNEPALNTFDEEVALSRVANGSKYKIINKLQIPFQTLAKTLDDHVPAGTEIAFMSIDAEGCDLDVLKSNEWERFRPRFLLVEDDAELDTLASSEVVGFLAGVGYAMVAKTLRTSVFKTKNK